MNVIKRYTNRKLYNTSSKQYITLEGIADLIRSGEEVQILDNTNGEDLTALTLTQIIFEQEKKQGGFLPRSVLTGLVQAGGDTLGSLRRTLASPLDLFRHVDQEIERRLRILVKQGEMDEKEAEQLQIKLTKAATEEAEEAAMPSEEEMEQLLAKHNVPTRNELQELSSQLEALVAKLDTLSTDE
ncbi:MAG: polyhydroxyalkanoate synthesis regulator DNA-binding domain-containing protein [Candidatus Promineifilaceae bacterium]